MVKNGIKRPLKSMNILANDVLDGHIHCTRHPPVVVDIEKKAKTSAHSSPSILYHMPADNLVYCPIVHIPGNKKARTVIPSAGDKHCDQSAAVSCESHPRYDNEAFQNDVHGTAAPIILEHVRSIKYPRRGAISVAHADLETETHFELKKEHNADKSDDTTHPPLENNVKTLTASPAGMTNCVEYTTEQATRKM